MIAFLIQFRNGAVLVLSGLIFTMAPALAQSNQIRIMEAPSSSPSPAAVGAEVTFNVYALDNSGATVNYSWDFGDGSERTIFDPFPKAVHRFTQPGRYAVLIRMQAGQVRNVLSFFLLVHTPLTQARPTASSTILLDARRNRIWVVNPDNNSVSCIDVQKMERIFEIPVGDHPRTLAQAPDGSIWVVNEDDATLSILDPQTGAAHRTLALPYGSLPFAVAFSPDGSDAYISLQGTGKILKLDPVTGKTRSENDVGNDPRGLAVTADSKRILVTRFISPADQGEASDVNAADMTVTSKITLAKDKTPDAENASRGIPNYMSSITIAPDGGQAWIVGKKDNTGRGLFRDGRALDFQSTVRAIVMRIDLATDQENMALRLDMDDSEMPSALAFGPLGDPVFIAFQGSNKVAVWDPNANVRIMTIPAVGLAPQGLVVDSAGGRLFVQNFMSRTVSVYDIRALLSGREYTAPELKVIQTVEKERLLDQILLGKQIFYNAADTRMSKDGYLSCASCHLDGGSDRRVWDFTDRGEGLRKTVSLLGRAGMGHGPVHWSANFDEIQDFENDIRGPFGGTGFMKDEDFHSDGRDRTLGGRKAGVSKELDALSSYVTSLKKVHASPFRQPDGSMTDEGRQGEMIFNREDVGCVRCHVPPLFTDSRLIPSPDSVRGKQDSVAGDIFTLEGFRLHDVGTLKPASGRRLNDTLRGLDTPTLKGIWETPPFLHDGSAATLEDLLTTANPQDKHGHTSQLSIRERGQLVAYLKQLDEGSSVARLGPHSNSRSKLRFTVTYVPAPGGYRLELELPRMSQMPSLVFHNLSGRVVATFSEKTLRDAEFMPGRLLLTWNGRDSHGNKMPPGLYSATACLSGDCQARNLIFIY